MKEYQDLTASKETIIKHYLPSLSELNDLAKFYYVFADATRLKIVIALCIAPMYVGDMSNLLEINQSTLSHQLQILRSCNIVETKRNKKNICYYIACDYVEKLIECGIDAKNK